MREIWIDKIQTQKESFVLTDFRVRNSSTFHFYSSCFITIIDPCWKIKYKSSPLRYCEFNKEKNVIFFNEKKLHDIKNTHFQNLLVWFFLVMWNYKWTLISFSERKSWYMLIMLFWFCCTCRHLLLWFLLLLLMSYDNVRCKRKIK